MNITGLDPVLWNVLWRASNDEKYDINTFLRVCEPIFKDHANPGVWNILRQAAETGYDMHHFLDSMSPNQLESKLWLVNSIAAVIEKDEDLRIHLFGGWFGHPIINLLKSEFGIKFIENIDIDENALHVCRQQSQNCEFEIITTHGNVTQSGPRDWDVDLVINTSSEHMPNLPEIIKNKKYRRVADKTKQRPCLFAIQSNNMFNVPDHINCVNSEDELERKCEFDQLLYKGSLKMPNGYRRFMVIGYV